MKDSREGAKGTKKYAPPEEPHILAPSREVNAEAERGQRNVEELSALVVDCAYKLHVEAGPGQGGFVL